MKEYQAAFARHKLLVIAPIVFAVLAGLGAGLSIPRQFATEGALWADAPVPNDSTVFSLTQPSVSAAAQEASVLQELLDTNEFLVKIGQKSPWASYLRQHPTALGRLIGPVRKEVSVSAIGPQVISVGLTASNGATAMALDTAIMSAFLGQIGALERTRDEQEIAYDKQSLQTATSALSAAQQQLSAYLVDHPQDVVDAANDPTATQLTGNVTTAEQLYDSAFSDYNSSELGLSHPSDSSQLHVIDPPSAPVAQGRKKKIVLAGIGGLVAGAVISLLVLTWLVWRNTAKDMSRGVGGSLGLFTVSASLSDMPPPLVLNGHAPHKATNGTRADSR